MAVITNLTMKVRKLKDDRWQVMRDDGASLALTYDEWGQAFSEMSPDNSYFGYPTPTDVLRQILDASNVASRQSISITKNDNQT